MDMTENFGYGHGYNKSWIFRIYIHILYPKMQLDIYPPNISGLWIYILDIYPKDIYPTQAWQKGIQAHTLNTHRYNQVLR